jgi:hypothetical protein
MDNETRDDRTSLLAAFARAPERSEATDMVTMSPPLPTERVIGAQQIAIPRDEKRVLEKIKVLAAAAGADWYYRFPVKTKGGGTDWIEGPSIKLANDLARLYGNCEVETKVTDLGDSWLIYARFTDYETGFVMTRPFQQRKGQRGMRTENDRALDIAFQIGASKAIRNVICNSLQSFADFALDEARNSLAEKIGKNLEGWRERCIQRIAERKIELLRVERVVGRAAKDWTVPDLARVVAMMQSIADGMTTIDEAFPPTPESAPPDRDQPHDGGGSEGQPAGVTPLSAPEAPAADSSQQKRGGK